MKIKAKLTIIFTLIFALLLLLFALIIYFTYKQGQHDNAENQTLDIRFSILSGFIIMLIFSAWAGHWFAGLALSPVSKLVENIDEITASNLKLRIDEGNGQDEIAELAIKFNHMLNRLEDSFDAQKKFVSHISHELRTPLSTMITELQLSQINERKIEEYKVVIRSSLRDARKLAKLCDGLLDFAKASYDQKTIGFNAIRLDELILDTRNELIRSNPEYKINIIFVQEIENDASISINGNIYLLKVAFINLMENGCKFSKNRQCNVEISFFKDKVNLRFSDTGIGISAEDMPKLFTPFFRGANKTFADGNGIGLSLTKKIVELHKGKITVDSSPGEGTRFALEFEHL